MDNEDQENQGNNSGGGGGGVLRETMMLPSIKVEFKECDRLKDDANYDE